MALIKDSGELYFGQQPPDEKKKRKRETRKRGRGIAPGLLAQQENQAQKPPRFQPGAVDTLKPFYQILDSGGSLDAKDLNYLKRLAWTTKDEDTSPALRAGIDAARKFFKDNPDLKKYAGIKYDAFHERGEQVESDFMTRLKAQMSADKALIDPRNQTVLRKLQTLDAEHGSRPDPRFLATDLDLTAIPELKAKNLNPELAVAIMLSIWGAPQAGNGMTLEEATNLRTEKNVSKIEDVDDVGGVGPGFAVTFDNGVNQMTIHVPWGSVPKDLLPGAAAVPDIEPAAAQTGTQYKGDERIGMLNKAWDKVFAGTKVIGGVPVDVLPAILAESGPELRTFDAAVRVFEALRDPYTTDPRNPYSQDPEVYFQFAGAVQDSKSLQDEDIRQIQRSGDASPLAGIVTPFAGEVVTEGGFDYGLKPVDQIRLDDSISLAGKEYAGLPANITKAGLMLTSLQHPGASFTDDQGGRNVLWLLQDWLHETNPEVVVDGKTWTFEMDEAIRSKQFASALMRNLSDPNDDEAEMFLMNEFGLPASKGSVAQDFLMSNGLTPPPVPSPEENAKMTDEQRAAWEAERNKTPEQRLQELATRLAVEARLPYESEASAVYKLWRVNPDMVMPVYAEQFEKVRGKIADTYKVNFGVGLDFAKQQAGGKGWKAGGQKDTPTLTKGNVDSIVYSALKIADLDLYPKPAAERPRFEGTPRSSQKPKKAPEEMSIENISKYAVMSPEKAVVDGSLLTDFGMAWNAVFHHPAATLAEVSQLEAGKHVAETGKLVGEGGKGRQGQAKLQEDSKAALLDQWTEYLTLQRVAHPEMEDEDFSGYFTTFAWTWGDLRRRAGGGYINMGTYLMQEADENYQMGDNMLAEFFIDCGYELVLFGGLGMASKAAKAGIKGHDLFTVARAKVQSELGMKTVGETLVKIKSPSAMRELFGLDRFNSTLLAGTNNLDDVKRVLDLPGFPAYKIDPDAWDLPLRFKMSRKAYVQNRPFLNHMFMVVDRETLGTGAVRLDESATRHAYEAGISMGLSHKHSQQLADEVLRILTGESDGSVFLRNWGATQDIYEQTALRSAMNTLRTKTGAFDVAKGNIPKGFELRAQKLVAVEKKLDNVNDAIRKTRAQLDSLQAVTKPANQSIHDLAILSKQAALKKSLDARDALEIAKRNLGGTPGYRGRIVERELTDAEKATGHRILSASEAADVEHNLNTFLNDAYQLMSEKNKLLPANDKRLLRSFRIENPGPQGAYKKELERTAEEVAKAEERRTGIKPLVDEAYIKEHGYISDDTLYRWWRDTRVRPVTKAEAARRAGRETGQIHAPKQGVGRKEAKETSKTIGAREAAELDKSRRQIRYDIAQQRKALRAIAPRVDDFEQYTNALFARAGYEAGAAEREAHRVIINHINDLMDEPLTPAQLQQLEAGTVDDFVSLAVTAGVDPVIASVWREDWKRLAGSLDTKSTKEAGKKLDLAEAQKVAKSKRRRKELAQRFGKYGTMDDEKLASEIERLEGLPWRQMTDEAQVNVRDIKQADWPEPGHTSLAYTDGEGNIYIDRSLIKKAWDDDEVLPGSNSVHARQRGETIEEFETYVVWHELGHLQGFDEVGAQRFALQQRQRIFGRPGAPENATREAKFEYVARQGQPKAMREEFLERTESSGVPGRRVFTDQYGHKAYIVLDESGEPGSVMLTLIEADVAGAGVGARAKQFINDLADKYQVRVHGSPTAGKKPPSKKVVRLQKGVDEWERNPDGTYRLIDNDVGPQDQEFRTAQSVETGSTVYEDRVVGGKRVVLNERWPKAVEPQGVPGVMNPVDRKLDLAVARKVAEQRAAGGEAIDDFRKEIASLQRLATQLVDPSLDDVAKGRLSEAALGGFTESGQPLVPAQRQKYYQPPIDARLSMTWRTGKGARLIEELNTAPWFGTSMNLDRASNMFKTAILARVATALRIVFADEFTRMLPEGIDPIAARHYLKEIMEHEAIPAEMRVELSRLYGVIRKSSYSVLDPSDDEFITAYKGLMTQWATDPVVMGWKNAYRNGFQGLNGEEAAKAWLVAQAADETSQVALHLRLTNRYWPAETTMKDVYGALGSGEYMAKLRAGFESHNVDDWIEAAHGQFKFFAENNFTKGHFIGNEVKPGQWKVDKIRGGRHGSFAGAKHAPEAGGPDALPVVVGRMQTGDIGRHLWLPQVWFGDILEGVSGHLTEITYAHFYTAERTRLVRAFAKKLGVDEPDDIWAAHKAFGPQVGEEIERLSMQAGIRNVQRVMYTAGTSQAEDLLRNIVLFLPAQRQYLAYWSTAIWTNPALLAYFHRLDQMPDYLEIRMPWQDESERSKFYIRGLLFATPGFKDDSPASKVYQMAPGLGVPGVVLGTGVNIAEMAGYSQPKELAMKMPGGDYYKDMYRPLNSSLSQFAFAIGTLLAGEPYQPLPEQIAGSNAQNLWRFSEAMKAQMSRAIKGKDMTDFPDMDKTWNPARAYGLKALLSAGWNFLVPSKLTVVDVDAQQYMEQQMEWSQLTAYQDRVNYIANNADTTFVKVLEVELAESQEDRQRLLYKSPEIIPYYITNIGYIAPEGEEYDFGSVIEQTKMVVRAQMSTEQNLRLQKKLDKEEKWFDRVYMPALKKREPWTGGNTTLRGDENNAYSPDSPSNLIRIRKDFEEGSGAFANGIVDPKTGAVHRGIADLKAEIGEGSYLSASDFASDPSSNIYKATETLFELKAGARYVRTARAYDDFTDLYRISHKEGEQEAIAAALQPFTQMSELERATVFGKRWKSDEEWIRQRVASVWDQYEHAYLAWEKKHPGKDHGDFRLTDQGEAFYAAVTKEVYKYLAGPDSSEVLAGGIAQQLLYTPLVRPHFIVYEPKGAERPVSAPLSEVEQLIDQTTGMGNVPGVAGAPLGNLPGTLPESDPTGTRKVKYADKVLPERVLAGIMAKTIMASKVKGATTGSFSIVWGKHEQEYLKAEAQWFDNYMKTADPITKYNVREAMRASAWYTLCKAMAGLSRAAWTVPSEYQLSMGGYKGRSSSENLSKAIVKQVKKKWLPAFYEMSPLFKTEFEFYNEKADGNLIWDMINTYR